MHCPLLTYLVVVKIGKVVMNFGLSDFSTKEQCCCTPSPLKVATAQPRANASRYSVRLAFNFRLFPIYLGAWDCPQQFLRL